MNNPQACPPENTSPELITTLEAAAILKTQPHTLEVWRCSGRHRIPFVKVGRLVRYRRADLDAWLDGRTVHGDAAYQT